MLPTRTLGSTGLVVSRIGLGLAAVGRPGYINLGRATDLPRRDVDALYTRASALLTAAVGAGIRYVDVARSYGRAEEFLGRWLRDSDLPPGSLTVGSKWGYRYTADWQVDAEIHEQKELSLDRFEAQLPESEAHLGAHLDLYQIHSATLESGVLDDEAVLAALVHAREQRRVRAIGLTLSGPLSAKTLDTAMTMQADGLRVFDVVQATFNVLDPSAERSLATAHQEGMGVIVKEVHANGRLTPANQREEDRSLRAQLDGLADRAGLTVDQLAMAAVLRHPFVDVVNSGAATEAQLASHLAAADAALADDVAEALAPLAEPVEGYWSVRASLPWS